MKVCMFVDKPLPDERPTGIGIAAFSMAFALARRGHYVYYVCRGPKERVQLLNEHLTVREIRNYTRGNLLVAAELRNEGYDIFHFHSSAAVLSLILCRVSIKRVVAHAHGIEPLRPIAMAIRRGISMQLAQSVLAISEVVKDGIVKNYHISPRKVSVVSNGVDCETFHPTSRSWDLLSKYGLGHVERLIISVGAVRREKGQMRMIELIPDLLGHASSLMFVNVGPVEDEAYSNEILAKARELGVASHVLMLDRVGRKELADLINLADLCVHPSTREGSAEDMAVKEEMACGKPVIAYAKNRESRTIQHGVDGMLVGSARKDELSVAILEALDSQELSNRLGLAARAKAVSKFSWDITAKNLERIYSIVLTSQ